jgi:transposase
LRRHPTTTQQLAWHEPNSPLTTAYDTHLLLQVVNVTLEDVSLEERLPCDVVLGVIERRIEAHVDWTRYTELNVLGLDEIALKKAPGFRRDCHRAVARRPGGDFGRAAGPP